MTDEKLEHYIRSTVASLNKEIDRYKEGQNKLHGIAVRVDKLEKQENKIVEKLNTILAQLDEIDPIPGARR